MKIKEYHQGFTTVYPLIATVKPSKNKAQIWEKPGFTCLGLKGLDIIIYVKKLL